MKKTTFLLIFLNTCVMPAEKRDIPYQNSDVRDALCTINTLTKVNKELTETMDNTILSIIKDLSRKYNYSNEYIASRLCTKKANEQTELQQNLMAHYWTGIPFLYIQKDMERTMLAADINFTYGVKQETPLMLSFSVHPTSKLNNIMALLLEKGADISARDWQGRNALMVMLQEGYPFGMDTLLYYVQKNKAYLAQQDCMGNTALHCCFDACKTGMPSHFVLCNKLKRLLKLGANPTIKNNLGQTPLLLAQKLGNPFVIDLLRKAQFKYVRTSKSTVRIANKKYELDSPSGRRHTL